MLFYYPDTEHLYTKTIQQIASQYGGKTYTWEMKSKLMGMMGREAAVAIIKTLELPLEPEDYMRHSQAILAELFHSCKFLPGQMSVAHLVAKRFISVDFFFSYIWFFSPVHFCSFLHTTFRFQFSHETKTDGDGCSSKALPSSSTLCSHTLKLPFKFWRAKRKTPIPCSSCGKHKTSLKDIELCTLLAFVRDGEHLHACHGGSEQAPRWQAFHVGAQGSPNGFGLDRSSSFDRLRTAAPHHCRPVPGRGERHPRQPLSQGGPLARYNNCVIPSILICRMPSPPTGCFMWAPEEDTFHFSFFSRSVVVVVWFPIRPTNQCLFE